MDNPDTTSASSEQRTEERQDEVAQSEPKDKPTESYANAAENVVTESAPDATTEKEKIAITTVEAVNTADDSKSNAGDTAIEDTKMEATGEFLEESSLEENNIPVPDKNNDLPTSEEPSAVVALKEEEISSAVESAAAADDSAIATTTKLTPSPENRDANEEKAEPAIAVTAPETENDVKSVTETSEPIVKEEAKGEEETMMMEIDSLETQEPDLPAEESLKTPAETFNTNSNTTTTTTYSTRGRSTETVAVEEKPERVNVRDAFEESPRPKDPPTGVSFLVEAMTEEERRTRTRFLPDVEGMHMLRKNEIKDDVALARSLPSIVSPAGILQTRTGRLASGAGRNIDSMDVDGDEVSLTINDDITTTIELPSSSLTIPSDAFVAPKGVIIAETGTTITVKEFEPNIPSPSMVESVTSFNPPRPPESVGGKKKHRMIRWERRPEDIEVDMKNYRRTVQRTRQELQKSEAEYERLEMIDAHLRRHFLNHSDLLNQEYKNLHDEMEVEVENLIKESDLVGSKTRSRNLSKVDVVMRDVLTMLTRNEQKYASMDVIGNVESNSSALSPGIGGLNSQAFIDWENSTQLESMKPCISWIEQGQQVKTPYGEGTVLAVMPPESPPSNDSTENLTADHTKKSELQKTSKNGNEISEEKLNHIRDKSKYDSLLPLRVKVRLDYGVGVFVADSIVKMESPAHFTDAKLAKRWKGMIGSAVQVGPCIDLQGMLPNTEKVGEEISDLGDKGTKEVSAMDIVGGMNASNNAKSNLAASKAASKSNDDFLPIGASLIPTKSGRGNLLHNMKIRDIEETLQNALYGGSGVLGRKSNPGVTKEMRKWEDDEQEYLTLRASVLQLKNALFRQRRIRVLNERTTTSMNDRYNRAEELVSEMRSDLKSLKRRLGDELNELGITDGMANQILFQFYQGHQEEDKGDASTPKRLRRASSMIGEMLTDIDMGNNRTEGDPRDSMDDQGTDDLSGDDLEAHRPPKNIRPSITGE